MSYITEEFAVRRRHRSPLWLLAVAGALLLLALGHTSVSAAPTLMAAKNPIEVPAPGVSGTTTVTWAGVPVPPAGKISLFVDGVVQIPTITLATSSIPLTVPVGGSRTVQLRDINKQLTLASLTVTAIETPPNCPTQGCIHKFAPVVHGTFAEFGVTTSAPTKLHVEVSTAPPSATYTFASVTSSADSPMGSMHNLNLLSLKPKTFYHYVVRAEDNGGFKYYDKGTFTTLKQRIDVTFTNIHIHNDSDALTDGDLKFWFYVENQAPIQKFYGDNEAGTGEDLPIAISGTVMDANGTLNLMVRGFDDDACCGNFCPMGLPQFGSGSNSCGDWVEATWQSLTITKSGPGEAYSAIFSIVAQHPDVSLVFSVLATYSVSYS